MRRFLALALAVVALIATTIASAAAPRARVGVRATSLGSVLVDTRGRTLYAFDLDKSGKTACAGACAALWPPLLTTGTPLAAGVRAAKLGVVKRGDGRMQATFAGHPLYFFAKDTKAGQVAGASVAHWSALSPAGAKVRPSSGGGGYGYAPPTQTTTNPDPGGGYYP